MSSGGGLLLGIDTATEYLALSLVAAPSGAPGSEPGAEVLGTVRKLGRDHAAQLMGELEALMSEAGVARSDVRGVGVGVGPGSYTGVRIGVATALGLATIFGQLVFDNALIGRARQRALRREQAASDGPDPVMEIAIRYGEGVELSTPPALDFGPNPATAGHWGAGGATAFADPDHDIAFGYVTGRMASGLGSSERARQLVAALYECL